MICVPCAQDDAIACLKALLSQARSLLAGAGITDFMAGYVGPPGEEGKGGAGARKLAQQGSGGVLE